VNYALNVGEPHIELMWDFLYFKTKTEPAGVARQQLHFLCIDKANEAKENDPNALPASRVPEVEKMKAGRTKTRLTPQTVCPAFRL
jgi:hypothetical protein